MVRQREPKVLLRCSLLHEPAARHAQALPGAARPPDAEDTDKAEAWALLDGLPLLPEDRKFVVHQVRFLRPDLLHKGVDLYARVFRRWAARCADPAHAENVGRRRANGFLRRWVRRAVAVYGSNRHTPF